VRFTTHVVVLAADGLPTEFRLFVKGWNSTENGKFLFDDIAAKSVMTAYQKWGVDLSIDLEHQLLGEVASDPTARDARGWAKLELRPDGSLWATGVTWTPDGAKRLTEKTQRYISPAFEIDPKTKRVSKMLNIALVAMPATHKTPALVAASVQGGGMDPSLIKQALEAIEKGDAKAALEILKGLVASAAGADASEPDGDEGSEGDGAEGVAPPAETEAVEDPKVVDSAAPTAKGDDSDDDDDKDAPPAKKAARRAMHAMLCSLTGAKSFGEALSQVEVFRASHLTLETERKKLAVERSVMESAERRKLVIELVTLGAEFPSTVWADDKATTIKPRWVRMPIAELRSHVSEQKAARGTKKSAGGVQPPAGNASPGPSYTALSAMELQICAETKCDPKDFMALKAMRERTTEETRLLEIEKSKAVQNLNRGGKG